MPTSHLQTLVILGATGRLGGRVLAELAHRQPAAQLIGVARNRPQLPVATARSLALDAGDPALLAPLLASAQAVVHACGLNLQMAQALTQAAAQAGQWPVLAVASSIAARPPADWLQPEDRTSAPPSDPYGVALHQGNQWLREHWQGPLHIALLPQLAVPGDPRDRLAGWLQRARSGKALVPGTGRQTPALLHVTDAAHLLADLALRLQGTGTTQLSNPRQETALALLQALLIGAGLGDVPLQTGTDDRALAGGDEALNLNKMAGLWPTYAWPSLSEQLRAAAPSWLGA